MVKQEYPHFNPTHYDIDVKIAGHVSQDAVKRYILEQEGKDVFEYSIFGNPKVKIGQFSLERWTK